MISTTISFADDAANMGVAMNASGTARSTPLNGGGGNSWSVFAEDWSQSFPNGVNYKYSDADGSGTIDINDIIKLNSFSYRPFNVPSHWRLSANNAVPELKVFADKDTVLPCDTITVKVVLGSNSSPIDSIYSLSLSLWSGMYFLGAPPLVNIAAVQFGDTSTNLMSY